MFEKFWSFKRTRNKNNEDGVVDIDKNVFVYRGQSQGKVPADVTHVSVHPRTRKIKKMVFEGHSGLQNVVIPSNVKQIGRVAFFGCSSLVELVLEEGVTKISNGSFQQCSSLTGSAEIILDENKREATITRLTIPATVEDIGWWAFAECNSLVQVFFPESSCLERFDPNVFHNCTSLAHVQLPRGLKIISVHVFSGCTSLAHIDLPDTVEAIGGCAFEGCTSLCEISFPRAMAHVGQLSFSQCQSLATVEFQEAGPPLKIYDQAFCDCTSLSAVALPSTLYDICFRVFDGCTSLLGVELASDCGIKHLDSAFIGCISLVNVSLPASVVDEMDVFPGCELLDDYGPSLKERYARFPVHQVCYNSSTATVDDLVQTLNSSPKPMIEDEFGMTAFHILATSANPRVDLLGCLLDSYSMEILCRRDEFGKTMMDYLLTHTSRKVVPAIQTVLQRSVLDALSGRDTTESWGLNLSQTLESIPRANGKDGAKNRRHIVNHSFFHDVGHFMRMEISSLLELALWKMRIDADDTSSGDQSRQICRLQSRAEVVIENVAECLWNDESRCSTALSFFPLCSRVGS